MIYKYSEENQRKVIKRSRTIMTVQYALLAAFLIYQLLNVEGENGFILKVVYTTVIFLLPVAWVLFDRNFRKNISVEYAIQDATLIVKKGGKITHRVALNSITEVKESKLGYAITSPSGTAHVLKGIENEQELIGQLQETN